MQKTCAISKGKGKSESFQCMFFIFHIFAKNQLLALINFENIIWNGATKLGNDKLIKQNDFKKLELTPINEIKCVLPIRYSSKRLSFKRIQSIF